MTEIRLVLHAPHASITNALRADLRREARVDVQQATQEVVAGAKTSAGLVELLITGVPAAAVGAVASVVTAFVTRRGAGKIVLKSGGDEITVEGVDQETQRAALERWLRDKSPESEGKWA